MHKHIFVSEFEMISKVYSYSAYCTQKLENFHHHISPELFSDTATQKRRKNFFFKLKKEKGKN